MIYLLRHCEKTAEAAGAPLSSTGFKQAKAIVSKLEPLGIKYIISSPYLRAQQSVSPFAKAVGVEVKTSDWLKEWKLAGAPRADWKAVLARGLANTNIAASGGESAKEVWARAKPVLQAKAPTLFATHGGLLTVVLGQFGRACDLESLFAIKSPDLFSIGPNGYHRHEL